MTPRRKHSKDGTIYCPICAPNRCERASGFGGKLVRAAVLAAENNRRFNRKKGVTTPS